MAAVVAAAVLDRPHAAPRESVPRIESQSFRAAQGRQPADSNDSLCSRTDTESDAAELETALWAHQEGWGTQDPVWFPNHPIPPLKPYAVAPRRGRLSE